MTFKAIITSVVASFCALLITTSCSSRRVYHPSSRRIGHGPPAHAPAHGHRRKWVCGVELIFDSGRGVYVVAGHPNCYYHDGYFYRQTGTVWEMSVKFDSGWASLSGKPLPPGLKAKAHARGPSYTRRRILATSANEAKAPSQTKGKSQAKGKAKGKRKF